MNKLAIRSLAGAVALLGCSLAPAEPVGLSSQQALFSLASEVQAQAAPQRNALALIVTPSISPSVVPSMSMWNLISVVEAQQQSNYFMNIQTRLGSINMALVNPAVPAVPLPASAWLFVVGVLGLFGSRLRSLRPRPLAPAAAPAMA